MSKFRPVWVAGLLGWVVACGARVDDHVGSGSNTNWLSGCAKDGECGDGICASGACTPVCDRDNDCSGLGDNAACGESVVVVGANDDSCAQGAHRKVCAPRCDGDDSCSDIGDGFVCQSGVCVPASCIDVSIEPYDACEGRACGDTCRECSPDDDNCVESEEVKYCNVDGACSGTEPECAPSDCSEIPLDECGGGDCVAVSGRAVVDCEVQPQATVACVPNLVSPLQTCAVNPADGLCYQFPSLYQLDGWEVDISCTDARCALEGCSVEECYSPTMNVSQAYEGTIPGCDCEGPASVCTGGTALLCISGKWTAVEDGPCEPVQVVCDGTLTTIEQCLTLFETCREVPGFVCGSTHRTSLCERGVIVSDETSCLAATDDESTVYCNPLENGLWCTGYSDVDCPENYVLTDDECFGGPIVCSSPAVGWMCTLQTMTFEQCADAFGETVNDPGDGSLYTDGCPNDGKPIAFVESGAEGALCCVPPGVADAG
jgi:hypothetical protein